MFEQLILLEELRLQIPLNHHPFVPLLIYYNIETYIKWLALDIFC